ncbi:transposable element Tc3 transposase [Trichonephila clavipes]|nr:transposable element Tc3 transposase [Trichonephila clavipes]
MVDFHKRILFSDEANFWLNDYVNKENCRIWSEANPQVYVETPLHPEKLTVWCALWAARATINLLKDTFGDRLISRFGPVNWPPRYCDLTPLDYFLWGYVKSLVYVYKPQTLDHLEGNIRRIIADMRPQMLEKVLENWTSRLDYIRASRGSPMTEIIFKMGVATAVSMIRSPPAAKVPTCVSTIPVKGPVLMISQLQPHSDPPPLWNRSDQRDLDLNQSEEEVKNWTKKLHGKCTCNTALRRMLQSNPPSLQEIAHNINGETFQRLSSLLRWCSRYREV